MQCVKIYSPALKLLNRATLNLESVIHLRLEGLVSLKVTLC